MWFLYAGGACVALAAILLAWKAGYLGQLATRLFDPRLIAARWWLVVLLLVPATHLISGATAAIITVQESAFPLSPFDNMSATALLSHVVFIFLLGPLPEEIGWRGYALPALLSRHDPLFSTLLLGAAWCVWHIPLFLLAGYYEPFGGAPEPVLFFSNILIISIFYTWIFLPTHGSILAAVLFHFSVNFTGEVFALSAAGELIKGAILAATAIAIVAYQRQEWTRKPPA